MMLLMLVCIVILVPLLAMAWLWVCWEKSHALGDHVRSYFFRFFELSGSTYIKISARSTEDGSEGTDVRIECSGLTPLTIERRISVHCTDSFELHFLVDGHLVHVFCRRELRGQVYYSQIVDVINHSLICLRESIYTSSAKSAIELREQNRLSWEHVEFN